MLLMGGAHENVGPPQESTKDGAIVLYAACVLYAAYVLYGGGPR